MAEYSMTIGGEAAATEATFAVLDPATGEVFAEAPECSRVQLDAAMESAAKAYRDRKVDEEARRRLPAPNGRGGNGLHRGTRLPAHERARKASGRRLRRGLRSRHVAAVLRRPRKAA